MLEKIKNEVDGSVVIMDSQPSTSIFNSKVRLKEIEEGLKNLQNEIDKLNDTKKEIGALLSK